MVSIVGLDFRFDRKLMAGLVSRSAGGWPFFDGSYYFPDDVVTSGGLSAFIEFEQESIRTVEGNRQGDYEAKSRDGLFFIHSRSPSLFSFVHGSPSRIIP